MEADKLAALHQAVKDQKEHEPDLGLMYELVHSKYWAELLTLFTAYQTMSLGMLIEDEKGGDKLRGAIEVLDQVVAGAKYYAEQHTESDKPKEKEN